MSQPDTSTATVVAEASPADDPTGPARSGRTRRRRRRRGGRRLRHPLLTAVGITVALLLVTELVVRAVEEQFPVVRAGDTAEMILKARRVDELAAEVRQPQVVVFGTSMMDSATSPSTFVRNSPRYDRMYNASVVGAPVTTQVRWMDEIVLDRLQPDVVVIGLHPIDLLLTDVFNLNIQANQADTVFARVLRETQPGPVAELDRALHEHSALVKHRGALRQPQVVGEAVWNTVTGTPPKPYIPLRDENFWREHLRPDGESTLYHGEGYRVTSVIEQLRKNLTADAFVAADARRLIDEAKRSGARVVLVVPPVPLATWKQYDVDIDALRTGQALLRQLADEEGVTLIDMTDEGYDESHFVDIVHMNDVGAERFSRELALRLDS